MTGQDHNKAQAATELAVFGAVLIFILGSIVRSGVSNAYTQDVNFKAMRMAMLASWQGSLTGQGKGAVPNTSHNTAEVLFLEDRLSPDFNKYGDIDRSPFMASGSGTFSYNLFYPISDTQDQINNVPVMDVYINGQHFPFNMGAYVPNHAITMPANCAFPAHSCLEDQCLRNQREWVGGTISEGVFNTPNVDDTSTISTACQGEPSAAAQGECQEAANACIIMQDLFQAGVITSISSQTCSLSANGVVNPNFPPGSSIAQSAPWSSFVSLYQNAFPNQSAADNNIYLNTILGLVQGVSRQYKLFYTIVPNPGGGQSVSTNVNFSASAPTCSGHPCMNNELSQDVALKDYFGNSTVDGGGASTNVNGVMQYDLKRTADYSDNAPTLTTPAGVYSQFPPGSPMRNYVAWQWAATAGTTAAMIGLQTTNNTYPPYDIDGRLKEVTIYGIAQDANGITYVTYEDPDGGDIDGSWDIDSCGPKPGLLQNSQIFTFTKDGTYLLIQEGKLLNPETGQVVRSVNKRDTIDLIQRTIQISNNTGRFCKVNTPDALCDGSENINGQIVTCANPNPVEICVGETTPTDNCFQSNTIGQTCYDTSPGVNKIFVRTRLEDRRGRSWLTNASGQMQIQ